MKLWRQLRTNLTPPRAAGDALVVRRFSPDLDVPLTRQLDTVTKSGRFVVKVSEVEGGWRFVANAKRVLCLFEIRELELENCILIFRAEMRSREVDHGAFLELRCHIPGDGEYFSKGTHQRIKGDSGWTQSETHMILREGQHPDRVTLNLTLEGYGIVELRNVELLQRPLPTISTARRTYLTVLWLVWRTLRFTALIILDIPLLALSMVAGDAVTWWPKRSGPEIGRLSG